MDDPTVATIKKLTDKIEKFLEQCKEEGDVTIDDVLKRLQDITRET